MREENSQSEFERERAEAGVFAQVENLLQIRNCRYTRVSKRLSPGPFFTQINTKTIDRLG